MGVLRDRWDKGDVTIGGLCYVPDPFAVEILGRAGFDWVCVDQQHGLTGPDRLVPLLQALSLTRTPSLSASPGRIAPSRCRRASRGRHASSSRDSRAGDPAVRSNGRSLTTAVASAP
jgi:hypothetical protein